MMQYLSGRLIVIAAFLTVGGLCAESSPADECVLSVVVGTTFGDPVGNVSVTLKSVGPLQEYRLGGTNHVVFSKIPYGLYDLEIQASGFNTRRERLALYQTEVEYRIGLTVAPTHATEPSIITGRINPAPKSGDPETWVRLVPIFSSDFIQSRVKTSGEFAVSGVASGKYLIALFNRDRLLTIQPLDYHGGKLEINLVVK